MRTRRSVPSERTDAVPGIAYSIANPADAIVAAAISASRCAPSLRPCSTSRAPCPRISADGSLRRIIGAAGGRGACTGGVSVMRQGESCGICVPCDGRAVDKVSATSSQSSPVDCVTIASWRSATREAAVSSRAS